MGTAQLAFEEVVLPEICSAYAQIFPAFFFFL